MSTNDDIIYIVCASTKPTSTSKTGSSNKFHKWVKRPDGMYDHTYGKVGTDGTAEVVSASKMQAKMASSLKPRGDYERVEVAADVWNRQCEWWSHGPAGDASPGH